MVSALVMEALSALDAQSLLGDKDSQANRRDF